MSQSQEVQQTIQQEQQNNIACKIRKRRNRRKRSHVAECNPKELVDAVNDSSAVAERKPLHTSMEKLQMAQKPATPVASRNAAGSNWAGSKEMSQSQEIQQEQQNNIAGKSRKRRNRRKRSHVAECNPKELVDTVNGSSAVAERKPLHTSMEKLQMAQKLATPVASRKAAGSNWEAVVEAKICDQGKIVAEAEGNPSEEPILSKSARKRLKRRVAENKYVAMDCEMVGVGFNGQYDMLARVSIVNKRGQVLLDKFVKPQKAVTDYRTSVSGIRPHDINNGEEFNSVKNEVIKIIQDKILVGHSLQKDLAVLHIKHPRKNIRDTSGYKPLCRTVANGRTPSLKHLTYTILGKQIQNGEHNSVEDARAAMSIYNTLASDWEAYIKKIQQRFSK